MDNSSSDSQQVLHMGKLSPPPYVLCYGLRSWHPTLFLQFRKKIKTGCITPLQTRNPEYTLCAVSMRILQGAKRRTTTCVE